MLQEVAPIPREELKAILTKYPFHRSAFILPSWEAIYANDAERDQTYAEAVGVHEKILKWYRLCGYDVREVPRLPVEDHRLDLNSNLVASDPSLVPERPRIALLPWEISLGAPHHS